MNLATQELALLLLCKWEETSRRLTIFILRVFKKSAWRSTQVLSMQSCRIAHLHRHILWITHIFGGSPTALLSQNTRVSLLFGPSNAA